MAHFAQLNSDNTVIQVIVIHNNDCQVGGIELEAAGIGFCKSLFGEDTVWVQTSYNGSIRKNYAGIGYTYDSQRDAFIPPKPFPSWLLEETTCFWRAPVNYPNDGKKYQWDETTLAWVEVSEV